jgi:hypothetical protein
MSFLDADLRESTLYGVAMVPLRAPAESLVSTYGEPVLREPHDLRSDAERATFDTGDALVVATVWRGAVHEIVYVPSVSRPEYDLLTIVVRYAEGQKWKVLSEGYMYQREDDEVRLWCSVMPPIGVATCEFLSNPRDTSDVES